MAKLLFHEIKSRRWAIIGWGIGIALFAGYIIILYDQFAEQMAGFNTEEIDIYKIMGDFGDMSTFKGFISAEIFTFLPVLLIIYAIINGSGTLAGEEDNGTLEPVLALPLHRWHLVFTKFVAISLAFVLILIIVVLGEFIGFSALPATVDTSGVELRELVIATFGTWPLIMFFATLSMFLGSITPSRRVASMFATVILIVSYFGNNLANLVEALEKVQFLFAFNYYRGEDVLTNGLNTGDTLVLLGANAVLLLLTFIFFQRRDITVGAWPWQRARIAPAGTD